MGQVRRRMWHYTALDQMAVLNIGESSGTVTLNDGGIIPLSVDYIAAVRRLPVMLPTATFGMVLFLIRHPGFFSSVGRRRGVTRVTARNKPT